MDFFKWAAPFYDLAMKVVGHGGSLKQLMERIEPAAGDKLLDLGGGTGQLLDYLPENVKVTLVDSSEEMLVRAKRKERKQKVKYINARGDNLPLPDDTFDYIVVADALHHFTKVDETIRELKRVLKPGGKLYIMEFDPETLLTRFISGAESLAGEPANFYSPEELSKLVTEIGLNPEIDGISKSLYILQGSK